MPDSLKAALRGLFLERYHQLRQHLQRRLGSADQAHDALQETYLRIERLDDEGVVKYPAAYLFRIALNAAEDQRKAGTRLLSLAEVDELYDMADELADPVRAVEGDAELQALQRALEELPYRRRAIVIAARLDDMPHRLIAARFGISVRTVEKELRAGLEHCCARLGRDFIQRFGPGAGKASNDNE